MLINDEEATVTLIDAELIKIRVLLAENETGTPHRIHLLMYEDMLVVEKDRLINVTEEGK